jgi:hypothetical protein
MKKGMEVSEFAQRLMDDRDNSVDFLVNTSAMTLVQNKTEDLELGEHVLHLEGDDHLAKLYRIKDTAHSQIAQHTKIGSRYYNRLREEDSNLLEQNVNYWLKKNPVNRTIRTISDSINGSLSARAFLSDRYKRLDNYDVANAVLSIIQDNGAKIESCNVTDDHMYIKAVVHENQREVKRGDYVSLGISVTNSETGRGAVEITYFLYRLVCENGMKVMDKIFTDRKYHIGKKNLIEGMSLDKAYQLYSDETKEVSDKAFFMQLQDTAKAVFNDGAFERIVDSLKKGTEVDVSVLAGANAIEMVSKLSKSMSFSKDEEADILKHFLQDEDSSQWGLANAITRTAQDIPNYDRATEFESIGWNIATMSENRLHNLIAVA